VASARETLLPGSEAWAKILPRLGACERIELLPLKPKDAETYVAEVTRLDVPMTTHSALYARSAGNPRLLQESVRLLMSRRDNDGIRPHIELRRGRG